MSATFRSEEGHSVCSCGAPVSELAGSRVPAVVVADTDGPRMNALLRRDLDHAHCDAGCTLVATRILFFAFLDPGGIERVLMCRGDHDSPERVIVAIEQLGLEPSEVLMMAVDRDGFHFMVKQIIRPRFEQVAEIAAGRTADLRQAWRGLTRRHWSAYYAVALGGIPGLRLLGSGDPMKAAAFAQAVTWQFLYLNLAYSPDELDLEEHLVAYIDGWEIFPGAVERLAELSEEDLRTEPPEGRQRGKFYRELLLAALRYRELTTPELIARQLGMIWIYLRMHIDELATAGLLNPERITLTQDRMTQVIGARGLVVGAQDLLSLAGKVEDDDRLLETFDLLNSVMKLCAPYLDEVQLAEIWATMQLEFDSIEQAFAVLEKGEWAGLKRFGHLVVAVARKWIEEQDVAALGPLSDLICMRLPEHMAQVGAYALARETGHSGLPQSSLRTVEAISRRFPEMDISYRLRFLAVECDCLRRLGRHTEVLERIAAVDSQAAESDQSAWESVLVIKGRVLREMSRIGEALAVFQTLATTESTVDTHEAYATTLMRVGHYPAALEQFRLAYEKAARLAAGYQTSRFSAQMMHCRSRIGLPPDGDLVTDILGIDFRFDQLSYAISAAALLVSPPSEAPGCAALLSVASEEGSYAFGRALAAGDMMAAALWGGYLCLRAERDAPAEAYATWRRITAAMGDFSAGFEERYLPLQVRRTIEAASVRPEQVSYWFEITVAALGDVDETLIPWLVTGNPDQVLAQAWNEAVRAAVASDLADDQVQIIAEMPRSRLLWPVAADAGETDLAEDFAAGRALPALRQTGRSLLVIEWLGGDSGWSMLTTVHSDGRTDRRRVAWPVGPDLDDVNAGLRHRLSTWRPGRRGSPFDTPGWLLWESWLRELIQAQGQPGDHLIVLRSPQRSSLPWHLAVSEDLTVSYETSWAGIFLSASDVAMRTPMESTGAAVVPRAGEDLAIVAAMQRLSQDVAAQGAAVLFGHECDVDALSALLAEVDVAIVAAHGYVSPSTGELAYMIADGGRLPLAHSVASSSSLGQRHRFSAEHMSRLTSSPQIVISGACSSALMSEAALGYNTGLLAAMRLAGLSTLVAPQWDVIGTDVFPVLPQVASLLGEGVTPSAAVRIAAARMRDMGLPPWRSECFIVEGAW